MIYSYPAKRYKRSSTTWHGFPMLIQAIGPLKRVEFNLRNHVVVCLEMTIG